MQKSGDIPFAAR